MSTNIPRKISFTPRGELFKNVHTSPGSRSPKAKMMGRGGLSRRSKFWSVTAVTPVARLPVGLSAQGL